MQLVQQSDALRLSGLTVNQMREWCGRRGIVVPDVPATGRGRHALYSWQTVLALRILKELRDEFSIEVNAWGASVATCQRLLRRRSFPSLWGMAFVFQNSSDAELIADEERAPGTNRLYTPLNPHLGALAQEYALPEMTQLPLFAALQVRL